MPAKRNTLCKHSYVTAYNAYILSLAFFLQVCYNS